MTTLFAIVSFAAGWFVSYVQNKPKNSRYFDVCNCKDCNC